MERLWDTKPQGREMAEAWRVSPHFQEVHSHAGYEYLKTKAEQMTN